MSAVAQRPPNLFETKALDGIDRAAGLGFALLFHIGLPLLTLLFVGRVLGVQNTPRPLPEQEEIILEAELVERGKPLEKFKLPDRKVPQATTAPTPPELRPTPEAPDAVPTLARKEAPKQVRKAPEKTARASKEDLLKRLGDRAQVFAEIADKRLEEGSTDAFPDGNANVNRAGDAYAGRLRAFFHRGFSVPNILSPAELKDLKVVARVEIKDNLRIGRFAMTRKSGNALFDDAVLAQLERLKRKGDPIPPPPEDRADDFIGTTLNVRFWGRELR